MSTVKQRECAVKELNELIANNINCQLIDVREYPEYAGGRIKGSRLIPLTEIKRRVSEIGIDRPIYLICRSGRRATEAQKQLQEMNINNVQVVTGGINAWQQAGYPLEQDQQAPWSLERQVRVVAGSLVLLGVLLSVFVAQPFIWLAGFVGAGLVFAGITDSCAMGMLLARLPWNRALNNPTCSAK